MGGKLPSTFTEGFLSGLGHPAIGPDHLAFLVAIGLIVGVQRLPIALLALCVAAMAVGVWMHVQVISISAAEVIVGILVLIVGVLVACPASCPPSLLR
jgi:urease accessory protein